MRAGILTVHLAPQQIVVALSLEFADELKTPSIEIKVSELEKRLRNLHPAAERAEIRAALQAGSIPGLGCGVRSHAAA